MRLYTPDTLLYPITVTKLLRRQGDDIEVNSPLFLYNYKSIVTEFDEDTREDVEKERTWPATFESELEGKLESLNVRVGQVINRKTAIADVEEACRHEIQFAGLCASCGQDMKEKSSYNETTARAARATVNTVHGRQDLLISEEEATKSDEEAKRRLLDSRRLSLVVDLDQTIIHASVEPTIGEWQNDPSNPNYQALRDVQAFQLHDDKPNTWYYIKPRPGLKAFLDRLSELYEMHIYTMGTRSYAENVAKIIDPDQKIFGDRIVTRSESGSQTAKHLKRLFPIDTRMVVIIDDRADVWHWISNLVKVNVFEFFVGIGDINSSFLPKRPELEAARAQAPKMERIPSNKALSEASESSTNDAAPSATPAIAAPANAAQANGETSVSDQLMSMAGAQDAKSIQEKTEEQDQIIQEQLDDRPLLKKQKELEELAQEEEAKASPAVEATAELLADDTTTPKELTPVESVQHKYRQNLLADDDNELQYLEQSLRNVHTTYYDELDRQALGTKGGRVAELRPGQSKKRSIDELENIPDAAALMDQMKAKVLARCHIVFSGVVPLGVDPNNHDAALWAKSFGATVSEHITKKTTHVIASPDRRTAKVRQAAKKPRIAIVSQHWLHACFAQWKSVDVNPYRIHSDAPANGNGALPESFDDKAYNVSSSDDDSALTEDETDGGKTPNGNGLTLDIDTDDEELLKYAPSLDRQDSSPVDGEHPDDWDALDDELEAFMAESGDDDDSQSDTESIKSGTSTPASAKKRKQAERESDGESEEGSRLQKRKKQAIERTTSLTNLVVHSNGSTPAAEGKAEPEVDGTEGLDEGDDDLEAALAAEMERQSEEDEA
ncbi:putative BRCT domain, FCP1 domain, HAD superfamily, BRCT domain superfamily, CTD phosphatase Fcp1 [Septoria linicola]|nr:putative BRCT domain, FCP1 domain, HAD superfamily, BRCT domain superfamily, CTD phosphatase Fcp1 [Septoria linicola]